MVLAGSNGVADYVSLLVLFKGKQTKAEWAVGLPLDTIIRMTNN